MKNTILFTVYLFLFVVGAKAQDLIYKRDKSVLIVKVVEIVVGEIKYKMLTDLNGSTISIDKENVLKIKFENGKVESFIDYYKVETYAGNKKNALKIDFLSPLFGQTTIGYERSLNPGLSIEFQFGIVGAGINNYHKYGVESTGWFLRAGYKYISRSDFYVNGKRKTHLLNGGYIKPDVTLGVCSQEIILHPFNFSTGFRDYSKITSDAVIAALMLNFGKQWVTNNSFLFDCYLGFGFGLNTNNDKFFPRSAPHFTNYYFGNSHAFIGPFWILPLALGGGFKIGYLLK